MIQQHMHSVEDRYQTSKSDVFARRFAARLHGMYLALVDAIEGIEDAGTRVRYASLLLYRLMFLYFLQHAGLLAGDPHYLQNRLGQTRKEGGNSFYREVLRPLFAGSELPEHFPATLNRLFSSHNIEQSHAAIALADEAFARIFALFDEYHWQLGDLPLQDGRTFTPEVLGALFAPDMQPKELGTYYTPGEITAYIARNTLLPALFTRTRERCGESCAPGSLLWQQLRRQPAHYLFAAARKGYEYSLPAEIAAGVENVAWRQQWQKNAPEPYALAGETWREVVARREHVHEIVACLNENTSGELDRLVTWNINQQLLALETLRECQQPGFLTGFYQSLRQLTLLDPTCGSGAFLCAMMPQLEPLYTACLSRMEELLSSPGGAQLTSSERCAFHTILEEAGEPAWRRSTIVRWIVEHNLYGVDLMEEAVEICRMRLYLKVLAVLPAHSAASLAPDFGQHIRVGNSLVGPLSRDPGAQTDRCSPPCDDYQQGFDWSQAFPTAMERRGFDVVLGNPPYVEYERIHSRYTVDGYATLETGNLYALTMERGANLLAPGGRFGMIVPSSATCTDGYRSLQKLLLSQRELHVASFSDQRGRLFAMPHPRLCIILYAKPAYAQPGAARIFTTPYLKLGQERRGSLFEHLRYTEVTHQVRPGIIPRYGSSLEWTIYEKLSRQAHTLSHYLQPSGAYPVYYTRKLSWFVQVTPFVPLILDEQGHTRVPSELKTLRFVSSVHAQIAFVALNSNLFYWLITTGSDCRNLNMREVKGLLLDLASIQPALQQQLCQLSLALAEDLRSHSRMRSMVFRDKGSLTIQCLYPARSKHLIDEIDCILAHHYGFSAPELDFLLHYDAQYRKDCMRRANYADHVPTT